MCFHTHDVTFANGWLGRCIIIRMQDEDALMALQDIDRHFSPSVSMVRQASTDVEELEKIIVEESKKRVENRDLSMGPN